MLILHLSYLSTTVLVLFPTTKNSITKGPPAHCIYYWNPWLLAINSGKVASFMAPTNRINYHLDDDHPGGVAVNFTHEWIWRNSDLSNKYTQNCRSGGKVLKLVGKINFKAINSIKRDKTIIVSQKMNFLTFSCRFLHQNKLRIFSNWPF